MYDAFPFIMGAVIILMGIFMVVCPKQATKKSMRDDEAAVKKVRNSGFAEIVIGILLIVIYSM